jgi:AraC-like DNA-binding protein
MSFLALYSRDRVLGAAIEQYLGDQHALARTPSWPGLVRVVKDRPITIALVDLAERTGVEEGLLELRALFPHLGLVLMARRHDNPVALFRLGRAGIRNLILLSVESLEGELSRTLLRASEDGTAALVTRRLSAYLPRRELWIVRRALDGVHLRWSADEFAARIGLSRPHLSVRLKELGLPSTGHLLTWARLLHAGRWLEEPGRTGESVSRQLEYSSGAAFRRALKQYTGATPRQVTDAGGLSYVLGRFVASCRLSARRAVA